MNCRKCGKQTEFNEEFCKECITEYAQKETGDIFGGMQQYPTKILNIETLNIKSGQIDINTSKFPTELYLDNGYFYAIEKDGTLSVCTKMRWEETLKKTKGLKQKGGFGVGTIVRLLPILIVIIVVIVAFSKCNSDSNLVPQNNTDSYENSSGQQNQTQDNNTIDYDEVEMPKHGTVSHTYDPYSESTSVLELELPKDDKDYYFIKLTDSISGEMVQSVFMYPGTTIEVYVPCGDFKIRYGSGEKWYGDEHLFGPNGGYSKSDEILNFTNEYGHTITLYPVTNGNFSTDPISFDEF